jgi:transposase
MSGVLLSTEDRAHFLRMMRQHTPSPVHRRMNALLLLDDGMTAECVADVLYIDAETVREHRRLYQASGVSGVGKLSYQGAEPSLTPEQRSALGAELDSKLYRTAKEICAFVEAAFAVHYTTHAMAKLLKRLGFVYKKPKCVPAKANEAIQRAFVTETLAPLMAAANDDQPLYFVDGTHPAYKGHPAFGWIRRGRDRELKSNHGRVNININGALSWPDRDVVHLEPAKITSEAMINLFEALVARHPTASAIHVVLDNASYNRSAMIKEWLARDGCPIRLVYLPPYAPNLNLIERFWWFLKKTAIWNEYYPTYADFRSAIDRFFENLGSYKDDLANLITARFRFIGTSMTGIL